MLIIPAVMPLACSLCACCTTIVVRPLCTLLPQFSALLVPSVPLVLFAFSAGQLHPALHTRQSWRGNAFCRAGVTRGFSPERFLGSAVGSRREAVEATHKMLRMEKAKEARTREGSTETRSFNEARNIALTTVGMGATRVHGEPRTTPSFLAAQLLISLPGGPWWTIHDRLEKQCQAFMSSERIGAQHLPLARMQQALEGLGILLTIDDLVEVGVSLKAYHKSKGILVGAFVDGLIAECKTLGVEQKTDTSEHDSGPAERPEHATAKFEREEFLDFDATQSSAKSVHFPKYESDGTPLQPNVDNLMRLNSPDRRNRQIQRFVTSIPGEPARAKDWRGHVPPCIQDSEPFRNKPAVTRSPSGRWQTLQMPTGVWLHTEQLGHYDPLPPSRLTTPRSQLDGTGHLTNSELMVFRSLKKNMAADQPFCNMNSFSRLSTAAVPRHKPLASALKARSIHRNAHLSQLAIPLSDTGHRMQESQSQCQTERAARATKPHYVATVPLVFGGTFSPHPSWAAPEHRSALSCEIKLTSPSASLCLHVVSLLVARALAVACSFEARY